MPQFHIYTLQINITQQLNIFVHSVCLQILLSYKIKIGGTEKTVLARLLNALGGNILLHFF